MESETLTSMDITIEGQDDDVNAYGSKNVYININTFKNILFNFDSFAECCLV